MARDRFTFLQSYKTALNWIDKAEHLDYLCAIIDYALDGKEPTLQGSTRACFELIRPIIDKGALLSTTAKENGKQGGAPKGNQNARKQPKTTQNNQRTTQNKLDKDKDKDKEMDMECVTARAKEFCTKYGIAVDTPIDTHTEIDFDALDKAYSKSAKWLKKCPSAKCLSWIIQNHASIIAGKYEDMGGGAVPNIAPEFSADEINSVFAELNEEL